jgi:retron-type reverse transcriptase
MCSANRATYVTVLRYGSSFKSASIHICPRTNASALSGKFDPGEGLRIQKNSNLMTKSLRGKVRTNPKKMTYYRSLHNSPRTTSLEIKSRNASSTDAGEIRKTPTISKWDVEAIVSAPTKTAYLSRFPTKEPTLAIGEKKKNISKIRFEDIVSEDNLKMAWAQLKGNPGMLTRGASSETINSIKASWFKNTSESLLKGNFVYPNRRRILIAKPDGGTRSLTISNPRVKIIEKAILNSIEPFFEGSWTWSPVSNELYQEYKSDPSVPNNDLKRNHKGWFRKHWSHQSVFLPQSYGFRPNRSAHGALKAIKQWRVNTAWLLDYDVRKAFDKVNRHRLKNIFLSHINEPRLWKEIEKMLNAGILDPSIIFEDKGVPQGSVLSPFLFNLYMNPFDHFMKKLSLEVAEQKSHFDPEMKKEYNKLTAEFSSQRLSTTLAKYGSVEAMKTAYIKKKKLHYKKWGRSGGGAGDHCAIQYVRYADDFIVGIVGSRKLATEVQKRIDTFLKSDLHLEVKQNRIVNRNEAAVEFLGFLIYLAKFKKKSRVNWKQFSSVAKYKRRVQARLVKSDRQLANAATMEIKKTLIETFRQGLSSHGLPYNKSNLLSIAENMKINLAENKENPAMIRWARSFDGSFDQNLSMALKFYIKQMNQATIPEDGSVTVKIGTLRDKFLADLDQIKKECQLSFFDNRRQAILKNLKTPKASSSWAKISEETAIKAADALTEITLKQENVRYVGINAPMNSLVDKLVCQNLYHLKRRKPVGNPKLTNLNDSEIITYYSQVMYGMMNYYRPADNFIKVKGLIEGLRRSCALTLSIKHKKPTVWVYNTYGEDITLQISGKTFSLPSPHYVANTHTKFLTDDNVGFDLDQLAKKHKYRSHLGANMFSQCAVKGCYITDVEIHHIRKLGRRKDDLGKTSVINRHGRKVKGITAMLSCINRKQIPLCPKHHLEFEKGLFSEVDTDFLGNLFNRHVPDSDILQQAFNHGIYENAR